MAERELELASANCLSPVTVLGVYSVEVTSLKSLVSPSRSGWQAIGSAVVSYSGPTRSLWMKTAATFTPARSLRLPRWRRLGALVPALQLRASQGRSRRQLHRERGSSALPARIALVRLKGNCYSRLFLKTTLTHIFTRSEYGSLQHLGVMVMSACKLLCGLSGLGILVLPLEQVRLVMKLITARSLIIISNFIQRRKLPPPVPFPFDLLALRIFYPTWESYAATKKQ